METLPNSEQNSQDIPAAAATGAAEVVTAPEATASATSSAKKWIVGLVVVVLVLGAGAAFLFGGKLFQGNFFGGTSDKENVSGGPVPTNVSLYPDPDHGGKLTLHWTVPTLSKSTDKNAGVNPATTWLYKDNDPNKPTLAFAWEIVKPDGSGNIPMTSFGGPDNIDATSCRTTLWRDNGNGLESYVDKAKLSWADQQWWTCNYFVLPPDAWPWFTDKQFLGKTFQLKVWSDAGAVVNGNPVVSQPGTGSYTFNLPDFSIKAVDPDVQNIPSAFEFPPVKPPSATTTMTKSGSDYVYTYLWELKSAAGSMYFDGPFDPGNKFGALYGPINGGKNDDLADKDTCLKSTVYAFDPDYAVVKDKMRWVCPKITLPPSVRYSMAINPGDYTLTVGANVSPFAGGVTQKTFSFTVKPPPADDGKTSGQRRRRDNPSPSRVRGVFDDDSGVGISVIAFYRRYEKRFGTID